MENIEDKLKNLEEWNDERKRVKPFIDTAVDYHNKARIEAHWKNYKEAAELYREAIRNYKEAVVQNPKYYLHDLLERIDHVIEEHINNAFNLKTSGDTLKNEEGIAEFINFIGNLEHEEKKYIDPYDIAQAYIRIGDFYYEEKNLNKAAEFYNRVIDIQCDRPFINREVYFNIGKIYFEQLRFKEALVSFVSVLSYDRGNKEVIGRLEECLVKLGIREHKDKFLAASPNDAKKLIMEVL